jgi:hypothetical protein
MAAITTSILISETREYMDAVGSDRWSDSLIKTVLNSVFEAEWSNILNAAPYYRFATRTVTTDADGQFALSDLDLASGDSSQYWYRIMSVSDGNYLYQQTRFQDVPLATTTNYLPSHPRLYYIAGDNVQILPVASDVTMTIGINHKPQSISDLLNDSSSEVVFPRNSHLILVWEAAAQLLLKGGAETSAAVDLKALARQERESLLDDIRRRTINPTMMAYPDNKSDWASG